MKPSTYVNVSDEPKAQALMALYSRTEDSTSMTKKQIFERMCAIAKEFCGSDLYPGLVNWKKATLQSMLENYEVMIVLERRYRKVFEENNCEGIYFQQLCLMEEQPEWFVRGWNCHQVALDLWRGRSLVEALKSVGNDIPMEELNG